MYVAIWRFRPRRGAEAAFAAAYGPQGDWARLFARGEGFVGVELLCAADGSGEYLTLDRWRSQEDFARFKQQFGAEYAALDARVQALTETEAPIGAYET